MNADESVGLALFGILWLAGWLIPTIICALKGKWILAAANFFLFFTFPFAILGAIRLAKPDSWWAKRNYGPDEMRQARERYESPGGEVRFPRPSFPVSTGTPLGGPLPRAESPPPSPPVPLPAGSTGFPTQPAGQHAWLCGVCGQGFNRESQVDEHSYAEHGVRGVATKPLPG